MSYLGGGPYHAEPCPECGAILWNGRCENPDCHYHWHPKDENRGGRYSYHDPLARVGKHNSILYPLSLEQTCVVALHFFF